ncbi:jg26370 [Pararge aegeria aegeria]|uniref:Jg26370 protein n=1 Tax=Pararge aegeria aegeria TaxID=348720 RepID=A0A8S4QYQ3_9NEOP|nr:jg26370 [Pararge aegeria aegeria]
MTPGDDKITAELLKAGGKPIPKVLQRLLGPFISQDTTPESWLRMVLNDLVKASGKRILKVLQRLFDYDIHQGTIPDAWHNIYPYCNT